MDTSQTEIVLSRQKPSTHINLSFKNRLRTEYCEVRRMTEDLCSPLAVEDYVIQAMPDASPAKWHLAHSSWFFETFILTPNQPDYQPCAPEYNFLFNSYYNSIGDRVPRHQRGLLSRPTVNQVYRYRRHIDDRMDQYFDEATEHELKAIEPILILGLNHEQQHQELILTDIKHAFACNPMRPAYRKSNDSVGGAVSALRWKPFAPALCSIGHDGNGFSFDNEMPRHQVFVGPFELASRLVTNAEYLGFMEDGGYDRPEFWLSDAWNTLRENGWRAPLYWENRDGCWWTMTLAGMQKIDESEPVCHISYYEADAFARWSGARLPTEAEWEVAAQGRDVTGNFLDNGRFHPSVSNNANDASFLEQMFGDVWEWTASPYTAYPGYQPAAGALGEYNGKFMCNQMVLRGGSCVTPRSHIRPTYRNFFAPTARWQFMGMRLAKNA